MNTVAFIFGPFGTLASPQESSQLNRGQSSETHLPKRPTGSRDSPIEARSSSKRGIGGGGGRLH